MEVLAPRERTVPLVTVTVVIRSAPAAPAPATSIPSPVTQPVVEATVRVEDEEGIDPMELTLALVTVVKQFVPRTSVKVPAPEVIVV